MKRYIHEHYHWIIAAVALLAFMVYGGIVNNVNSLYLVPVSESLNVSRTAFSFSSSARGIAAFVTNFSLGFLYKKFGYRKLASIGLAIIGLAFLGYASAKTVTAYIFSSVFVGLFDAFCNSGAISLLINDWFESHRGLVYGAVTASSGFGGSIFCEVLSSVMEKHGWRQSHVVSAVCLIAMAVCVFILVRTKPEDMGLRPFGEGTSDHVKKKSHHPDNAGMPMSRIIRTPTFYLMLLVVLLSSSAALLPLYVLVAHLQDQGFSLADAARVQSIAYLIMTASKILDGFFSDLVGARSVSVFTILCCAASAWLFADVSSMQAVWLPTVLFAFALPMSSTMQPLSTASIYGQRAYDTLVGIVMALVCLASMVSMPIMNIFYGVFGSYTFAYRFVAIMSLVSLVLYILVCKLADRDARKYEEYVKANGRDII